MFDANLVQSLGELAAPVLTAYLETTPADGRNVRYPPSYLIWLKSQAKIVEESMPGNERKAFREQVQRLEKYLEENPPGARGVAACAGEDAWQFVPLRVRTENELFWGLPSTTQLLWLMEEHRPCGFVLADYSGSRLYHYWMGEATGESVEEVEINTTEWRRKDLTPPSQPGIENIRGTHRDAFERRIEAQYVRFFAREAQHISHWAERQNLNPVFLAGPNKVLELAWAELPKRLQARCVLVRDDLQHLPLAEFETRIETEVQRWDLGHQRALVAKLLSNVDGVHAVIGIDDTLIGLQEGLLQDVIVLRHIDVEVRQCTNCGWTDRTSASICPACGGARLSIGVRTILPRLAKRYKVALNAIADDAGEDLRRAGGIGGWLK